MKPSKASGPAGRRKSSHSTKRSVRRSTTTTSAKKMGGERAVPVSTALRSLIRPAALAVAEKTVYAEAIHQPVLKVGPTPSSRPLIAPPELIQARSRFLPMVGVLTAVALVSIAGFVTRSTSPSTLPGESSGKILGLKTSQPLSVSVTVRQPTSETTVTTTVASGTVTEALARSASALHGSLTYVSRGASIYLASFLHQPNDATGQWVVELNGTAVNDLSSTSLSQGDTLTVTWE